MKYDTYSSTESVSKRFLQEQNTRYEVSMQILCWYLNYLKAIMKKKTISNMFHGDISPNSWCASWRAFYDAPSVS